VFRNELIRTNSTLIRLYNLKANLIELRLLVLKLNVWTDTLPLCFHFMRCT